MSEEEKQAKQSSNDLDFNNFSHSDYYECVYRHLDNKSSFALSLLQSLSFNHLQVNTTVSPTVTETVLATTTTYDAVEYFAIQANGTGTSIDGMFLVDTTPYYQVPENFTDADGNNYTDYVDVNNPDYGVVFATKHISTASHFYLFECTTLGLGNESTDSTMWWNLNSTNSSQPYFSRHNPYESTDGIYCAFDDHDILPGQYRSLSCFYDEFRNNDPANLTVCNTNELWVAGNSTADCSPITLLVVPQHQYDDGLGGR